MSHIKFEPLAGTNIDDAIMQAICMAETGNLPVDLTFNGTDVRVECSHIHQVKEIWAARRPPDKYAVPPPSPGAPSQRDPWGE